ncbi:MAG: phosphoenolpyruvate carboxykinase (GTP) [Candidatus Marinimicrobia bacterium]|nr:phosphoenolpyruvate carboxykinase (GTP) [Candidatus Neomarinimicrobiota bacterium]
MEHQLEFDKAIFGDINLEKLKDLRNPFVEQIVDKYVKLCRPSKVTLITDSDEDIAYLKQKAIDDKEETPLKIVGHTIHFDGYYDQARDKENTKILISKGETLSKYMNTADRDDSLEEIMGLLDGIMADREMLVSFFCLGPANSRFSIPSLQLTDSAYVAHSESILYRPGYGEFKNLNGSDNFFHFIHSSGELDENMNSKNIDKRRIYMDIKEERVFSVNTQYAGNSVGLKKLALRLAVNRANKEEWLCEHMLIMGAKPEGKDRTTYFAGAFPSACGKTSTAMIPGQLILGDDIAYIRKADDGRAYAVNVEQGIFGIIEDVNPIDDPVIYKTITSPRELIVSNVLVKDEIPYWLGMGKELPSNGVNFSGEWSLGNTDNEGKEILPAHKNARYTVRISELDNSDPKLHDPEGVPLSGIIYGGRDSDINPPVLQSLNWTHGVFVGATLESETTAATIGKQGVRKHNPMANLDFLVVNLGTYIRNHLKFGESLEHLPLIFSTNYFLKDDEKFLNDKTDKKVWLMWMEGRVHNDFDAIQTPIGFIPLYDDVRSLFSQLFDKTLSEELYERLFSLRTEKLLRRMDRMEKIYGEETDIPQAIFDEINTQKERLLKAKSKYNKDVIPPFDFD